MRSTTLSSRPVPGGNYANNERMTYDLSCADGEVGTLSFTTFETEAGWDFVSVYDGPDESSPFLLDRASGDETPLDISSTGSTMFVTFRTDSSVTRAGFSATFTCLDESSIVSRDCVGAWSECGADCADREFTVSVSRSGHGSPCAANDGVRRGIGATTAHWR